MTTVADPAVGPVTTVAQSVERIRETTLQRIGTELAAIQQEAERQLDRMAHGFDPSAEQLVKLSQALLVQVTRASEQQQQVGRLQTLAQTISEGR